MVPQKELSSGVQVVTMEGNVSRISTLFNDHVCNSLKNVFQVLSMYSSQRFLVQNVAIWLLQPSAITSIPDFVLHQLKKLAASYFLLKLWLFCITTSILRLVSL